MGVFESEKSFSCNPALINEIAQNIVTEFQRDGYECAIVPSGYGTQISIRKGGMFKAALGLKTSLNVVITPIPNANAITIKAGVGLFAQQAIPTAIMLFVFWPVIVTQIWGLVQQSHLDDKVMTIAERTIIAASSTGYSSPVNKTTSYENRIPNENRTSFGNRTSDSEQDNWDDGYGKF